MFEVCQKKKKPNGSLNYIIIFLNLSVKPIFKVKKTLFILITT